MYNLQCQTATIRKGAVITHLALARLATAAGSIVEGKDQLSLHVGTSQTGGTDLAAVHPVLLGAAEGGTDHDSRGGSLGSSLALAGEVPLLLLGIASVLSDVVADLGGVGREEGRRGDDDERNGRESHFVDDILCARLL